MAEPREVFPILSDVSGYGVPVDQMQQGWSPTGKNGLIGFSFKDSSGNVVLPQLNAAGQLPVVTEGAGVPIHSRGTDADGDKDSFTSVVTLSLQAGYKYSDIGFIVSSRREAHWEIIHSDDGAETILADIVTGPGQFSATAQLNDLKFTAGATGTQELLIKAKNYEVASAMYAYVEAKEIAP
jgi:hypothetical protein